MLLVGRHYTETSGYFIDHDLAYIPIEGDMVNGDLAEYEPNIAGQRLWIWSIDQDSNLVVYHVRCKHW